jgi:hypothetical protein
MVIDGYSIGGCWCLLMDVVLVASQLVDIGGYYINGY